MDGAALPDLRAPDVISTDGSSVGLRALSTRQERPEATESASRQLPGRPGQLGAAAMSLSDLIALGVLLAVSVTLWTLTVICV